MEKRDWNVAVMYLMHVMQYQINVIIREKEKNALNFLTFKPFEHIKMIMHDSFAYPASIACVVDFYRKTQYVRVGDESAAMIKLIIIKVVTDLR